MIPHGSSQARERVVTDAPRVACTGAEGYDHR